MSNVSQRAGKPIPADDGAQILNSSYKLLTCGLSLKAMGTYSPACALVPAPGNISSSCKWYPSRYPCSSASESAAEEDKDNHEPRRDSSMQSMSISSGIVEVQPDGCLLMSSSVWQTIDCGPRWAAGRARGVVRYSGSDNEEPSNYVLLRFQVAIDR